MLIDIVVYDELDALGPLEVLRNAGKAGADVVARLVTRRPQEVVLGSNGLRFLPRCGVPTPGCRTSCWSPVAVGPREPTPERG